MQPRPPEYGQQFAAMGNIKSYTNPVVVSSIHIPLDIIGRAFRRKGLEAMAVTNFCSFLICGLLVFFVMPVVWIKLLG